MQNCNYPVVDLELLATRYHCLLNDAPFQIVKGSWYLKYISCRDGNTHKLSLESIRMTIVEMSVELPLLGGGLFKYATPSRCVERCTPTHKVDALMDTYVRARPGDPMIEDGTSPGFQSSPSIEDRVGWISIDAMQDNIVNHVLGLIYNLRTSNGIKNKSNANPQQNNGHDLQRDAKSKCIKVRNNIDGLSISFQHCHACRLSSGDRGVPSAQRESPPDCACSCSSPCPGS